MTCRCQNPDCGKFFRPAGKHARKLCYDCEAANPKMRRPGRPLPENARMTDALAEQVWRDKYAAQERAYYASTPLVRMSSCLTAERGEVIQQCRRNGKLVAL